MKSRSLDYIKSAFSGILTRVITLFKRSFFMVFLRSSSFISIPAGVIMNLLMLEAMRILAFYLYIYGDSFKLEAILL